MKINFDAYDEMKPLAELEDSPYQRNVHPKDQIEDLARSMKEDGIIHPIHVVKGTNRICFGHGRRDAAKLNKYTEYPVVYHEFENPEHEYRLVQSDNAYSQRSELDVAGINRDLASGDLGPFDIKLLGLKDFKVDPWESDFGAIDKVETNLDGIQSVIKVVCNQEDKDKMIELIEDLLVTYQIEGAKVE